MLKRKSSLSIQNPQPQEIPRLGVLHSCPLSRQGVFQFKKRETYFALFSLTAACAAAKRAIGTRNGEQET
ncbi:hypothetical protein CAGA_11180 [Caproiciproducens galactitolivorans]|uniref:Uncharacterized protein n=1 Tax=Caproiciproducens galactitolivorans TaxID=642589 RepID=A0A4Z0YDY5_9FIRM|nr:hypothetical protein CAGA_11180 [Caproiciproducens galactitolivorans]